MKRFNKYCVILAGGKGERLWPLSRNNKPKQLLSINNISLLEHTINRVESVVPKERLWVITTKNLEAITRECIGSRVGTIIAEPVSRNTAPAIALTCQLLAEHDAEALVTFLPADHFVVHKTAFVKALKTLYMFCAQYDEIGLLGMKPRWAATGYGYIEYVADNTAQALKKVLRFHEKPNQLTADTYITLPTMLWNVGIFCAKVNVFLKEFELRAPALDEHIKQYLAGTGFYEHCEDISFDYTILEKSDRVKVLPVQFGWSDIGNLDVFLGLQEKQLYKDIVTLDSDNNLVRVPDKLVALIGIHNLCIVETDDVLLIVQRDKAEKVKHILSIIKEQKNNQIYL